MIPDFEAYFEEQVIPLIAREHPQIIDEMSVMVQGSVGFHINDDLSDLDVELFLPENLWKERGGRLMLTLLSKLEPFVAHPYRGCSLDPLDWENIGHSEIAVHPLSQLLCGQAEAVLAGEDLRWEEVPLENLLQVQIHPVLIDAHRRLARLREITAPDRYPERLWVKHLICTLVDLIGEPKELEKAVRRDRPLEAQIIMGEMLPRLFRIVFLINRRYYPWRRCFFRLFKELPVGPKELVPEFDVIGSDADWHEKSQAVHRIVRILSKLILDSGMLTAHTLTFLPHARALEAWDNPHWMDRLEAHGRKAEEAGYDWLDGWVWDRWGWQ